MINTRNMNRIAFLLAFVAVPLAALAQTTTAPPSRLNVRFGQEGPESMTWDGREMLMKQPAGLSGQFAGEPYQYGFKLLKAGGPGEKVTRTYEGVTVTTAVKQSGDRLLIDLEVRNDADKPLTRAVVKPLRLQFPKRPNGGSWRWGYSTMASSYGEPAVVVADYGSGQIAVCQEDFDTPARVGFGGSGRGGLEADVQFETLGDQAFDNMPVEPGATVKARLSVRFAAAGTTLDALAGDVYKAYSQRFPAMLKWNDNRPIGALFLGRDNTKWEKNPRGWLNDDKLDVTTPEGREQFRQKLMKYADNAIGVIKATGGQGMIAWDIEGDEFPHATTYLGDPRVLPIAAPEMDPIADEYFKKFRDAGLRTGVCIRPTTIVQADPQKYPWIKTRLGHMDNVDALENICDKIAYAKKRWGCTIFYMDTPGLYMKRGDKATYFQIPTRILRQVHQRHPDILLFPEFADNGAFATGSRYGEFGGGYRTSDAIRLAYPRAFTCWAIKDDPMYPHWDEIVSGIGNGDILLFRGWFGDHLNVRVKQAWTEAEYRKKPLSESVAKAGDDAARLTAALSDADPAVRYQAAVALGKTKTAGAAAPLVKAMQGDAEWIVRRAATQSLGAVGGPEALAALGAALAAPQSDLQWFAANALGEAGSTAVPVLVDALGLADHQRWEAVAAGLARIRDASAVPALERILREKGAHANTAKSVVLTTLKEHPAPALFDAVVVLLGSGPGNLRTQASGTLGAYKDERAIEPLIELLEDTASDLYYAKKAAMHALEDITSRDGSVKSKGGGGESGPAWRKLLGKEKVF